MSLLRDENTERLGRAPILRLMKDLSIPAMVGMVLNAAYNVVDGIFIGRLVGRQALAGVTVAFPLMMVAFAIIIMVATGTSAMFSIHLGRGHEDKAAWSVGNAYSSLFLLLSSFVVLVLLMRTEILHLFGGRGEVLAYANEYVRIALPFQLVLGYQVLWENLCRAEGKARVAMYSIGLTSLLNIGLDYLFIGPFNWGVTGAAVATAIAQLVGTVYLGFYVYHHSPRLKLARGYLVPKLGVLREIYSLGMSSFARQTTFSLQALILNKMVEGYGGDLGLAIVGILGRLFTFLVLPVLGLVQGMRPILSYNYGAKLYGRAKDSIRYALMGGTIFLFLGFLVSQLFPAQVVSIFTQDPDLLAAGAKALVTATVVFPLISVQIVGSASFQSLERPWLALIFSVLRQILLFIPLLLILPPIFGFDGIWYAYPVSDVLSFIITGIVLRQVMAGLDEEEARSLKLEKDAKEAREVKENKEVKEEK